MTSWGRFIKAVFKGEWKISVLSWLAAIATVIYVISPIDLIPELLVPFVGYIDDLGVWGVLTVLIAKEKGRWEDSLKASAING